MENEIIISKDQKVINIGKIEHVFSSYINIVSVNNPCGICSVFVQCEKQPELFPCCEYERKDRRSGIYKLKK